MSKRIPKTIISFEHNYYLDEDVFKMVNKLEQENKQLKEKIKNYKQENKELKANKNLNHVQKKEFEKLIHTNIRLIHCDEILTELEEYLQNHIEEWENDEDEYMNGVVAEDKDILHLIQELKEKYK